MEALSHTLSELFALLTDPLFRLPFVAGLLTALLLPLVGCLLRLREEWLAALGLAHLAGAGALLSIGLGGLPTLGAALAAVAGALAKGVGQARGNAAYVLMMLVGWSTLMLLAANTSHGETVSRALLDGQLYFANRDQLVALILLASILLPLLPWLSRRLMRARLLPLFESANRLPRWRWHLGFDLLAALTLALGAATVGLVAAFALAFVPSWIAFRLASSWRSALTIALALSLLSQLCSFTIALLADQPFGPTLVGCVMLFAVLLTPWLRRPTRSRGRSD